MLRIFLRRRVSRSETPAFRSWVRRHTGALLVLLVGAFTYHGVAQDAPLSTDSWQMQFAAKATAPARQIASVGYGSAGWYKATVPGTVLSTLVDNGVYPDPLYGENMRSIPEDLNRQSYWFRTVITVPASYRHRQVWLDFGGINYSAAIWVNGREAGNILGAFHRGEFNITKLVKPGSRAAIAVLVKPQPHPGVPHQHTQAGGVGKNGGITALDGPTFLSTIGWDWLPAVPDRDTGIWQPVKLRSSGSVRLRDPYVTSELAQDFGRAALHLSTTLQNTSEKPVSGDLVGTITGDGRVIHFKVPVTAAPGDHSAEVDSSAVPELVMLHPKLWWPNGYGAPNLYTLSLRFETQGHVSDEEATHFGIRKVEYAVPGSDNLTLVVNGVKVMVRGGDWGLDDAMKRLPRERLDAQIRMHQMAHLNMIRNWVGQSTSPELYEFADKYGIMLWDEFFQPNPGDGPNVEDIPTYLENVRDKVLRYRSHPSIVIWCARNEGRPPKSLDDALGSMMAQLDPTRLYQSSSAEGRGVSSHGPYYWRSPRFFYQLNEAFKTETGSVSVPTMESIQGMMPRKDWETINDDWAEHDMAAGAQRGDEYPHDIAQRYGHVRNLADFVRKSQLANYEAFRGMYESRNAQMFTKTTGILTWMSHPAHPSFIWQLYDYDLEPNAALYATMKASEPVHVQLDESDRTIEVVNNRSTPLAGAQIRQTVYSMDGHVDNTHVTKLTEVGASSTQKAYTLWVNPHISEVYFLKLDLLDSAGTLLSTNLYWQNVAQDDYRRLEQMPTANLTVTATEAQESVNTLFHVTLNNATPHVALMTHLQLHRKKDGARVLPAFASDNYISLAPGETREVTIEARLQDVEGGAVVLVDGYNVGVQATSSPVEVRLNENAQPDQWPASNIVSDREATAN